MLAHSRCNGERKPMTPTTATTSRIDLDYFISLADKGDDIELKIELDHHVFDKWLFLIGKYSQSSTAEKSRTVFRILSSLYLEPNLLESRLSVEKKLRQLDIAANKHLTRDYARLKEVGITFEEKYF